MTKTLSLEVRKPDIEIKLQKPDKPANISSYMTVNLQKFTTHLQIIEEQFLV